MITHTHTQVGYALTVHEKPATADVCSLAGTRYRDGAVPFLISKMIELSVLGYIKCTDYQMLIIKPDVNTLFFALFSI